MKKGPLFGVLFGVFSISIVVWVLVGNLGFEETLEDKKHLTTINGKSSSESGDHAVPVANLPPVSEAATPDKDSGPALIEPEIVTTKIAKLIGDEVRPSWCEYATVVDTLDDQAVPLLREMLQDNRYRNRWAQISYMIAWLSQKDDAISFEAILAYIRRPDMWSDADTPNASEHLFAKARALGYLGLFKVQDATKVLRGALSQEGAGELIGAWVNLPHAVRHYHPPQFVTYIRGYAARGLVLSQTTENVELVRKTLQDDFSEFRAYEDRSNNFTDKWSADLSVYYLLADSMAQNDMIVDIGMEEYLRIYNTHDWSARIRPYLQAY